jgi:hypothetical protein
MATLIPPLTAIYFTAQPDSCFEDDAMAWSLLQPKEVHLELVRLWARSPTMPYWVAEYSNDTCRSVHVRDLHHAMVRLRGAFHGKD